jgi:hypothetical protein
VAGSDALDNAAALLHRLNSGKRPFAPLPAELWIEKKDSTLGRLIID